MALRERLRDYEHLLRMALLFALGALAFVTIRAVLVPDEFGKYGHYRPAALDLARAQQPLYAGRLACVDCHDDVVAARVTSAHASIGCETCHGALARHAADPAEQTPLLPEPDALCLGCHASAAARPNWFAQIEAADHAMGEPCASCHAPHDPEG